MYRVGVAAFIVALSGIGLALAQPAGRRAESPAASAIPETLNPQTYAAELVDAGRAAFAIQCGFCHGREATGGAGGSDLTRSELVARDIRGDLIGEVVRTGRPDAGMPPFTAISGDELGAIVAYIHDQKERAASLEGGRQAVSADDLTSGDVDAGRRFFATECASCHSADGDLAGIASRMSGLRLLQQMLYPRPGGFGGESSRTQTLVTVMTEDGQRIEGELDYRDEFTIALTDEAGRYRSFNARKVDAVIRNPLDGHIELLGRYTDDSLHDVITYLHTLR
jgi:cytochrome c oxidase cbb3-type subunit 3